MTTSTMTATDGTTTKTAYLILPLCFSPYFSLAPSQVGLDKLSSTKEVVATLQEELTVLQPQLVKTMKEVRRPACRCLPQVQSLR